MRTPPRLTLSNGRHANDGTGDTLRDAADKINRNFERIWPDIYSIEPVRPGRGFVAYIDSANPDSGGFGIPVSNANADSGEVLKFSRWDTNEKSFTFDPDRPIPNRELSIFSNDSNDKYSLVAIYTGEVSYSDSDTGYWKFTKTSKITGIGNIDSGDSYYISLQGIW
jgi:hypothetical protein